MKLLDLDAEFVGWRPDPEGKSSYGIIFVVDSIDQAHGVRFQCPKCAEGKERGEEDGRRFVVGAHSIICWFKNPRHGHPVPDEMEPGPGRWNIAGTSLEDLTFVGPGAASVKLNGGCGWHGFVKSGDAS